MNQLSMFDEPVAETGFSEPKDKPSTCPCGKPGQYLLSGTVFCLKCLLSTLRARKLFNKTHQSQPYIVHCDDGFECHGPKQGYRSAGKHRRIQICRECKEFVTVPALHTGDPILCPDCSYKYFKEQYP